MKKILFVISAIVAMSFASCGGNKAAESEVVADGVAADTVEVADSVVADTLAVDTLVEVAE